jgi:hypothetical protein
LKSRQEKRRHIHYKHSQQSVICLKLVTGQGRAIKFAVTFDFRTGAIAIPIRKADEQTIDLHFSNRQTF